MHVPQEGGALADELLLQLHPLVSGVHEHEHIALRVEELEILLLKPHSFRRSPTTGSAG